MKNQKTMVTIQTALEQSKTQGLYWIQSSPFSRHYELHGGNQIAGYLTQKKENYSIRIPLLHFQPRKKWLTITAQIRATSETPGEPALSLMLLSGWFNLLLNSESKQTGRLLNQ